MRVGQGSPGALRTHRYSNCLFSSVFFAGSKQDAKFDGTSVGSMDRLALESLALVPAPAMSGAATFMPFVDLAGGADYSIANAISADGAWVGDRTFKLSSGITSEPGRYVKSLGEPVAGPRPARPTGTDLPPPRDDEVLILAD